MKVGVGVYVVVIPNACGSMGAGVSVTMIAGTGEELGAAPPGGVGVMYCPHNDAFPIQDVSIVDVMMRRMTARFTKRIIPVTALKN